MTVSSAANAVLAKARAMYGKRLTAQNYTDLLACRTVNEAAAYLKAPTAYADAVRDGVHRVDKAARRVGRRDEKARIRLRDDGIAPVRARNLGLERRPRERRLLPRDKRERERDVVVDGEAKHVPDRKGAGRGRAGVKHGLPKRSRLLFRLCRPWSGDASCPNGPGTQVQRDLRRNGRRRSKRQQRQAQISLHVFNLNVAVEF